MGDFDHLLRLVVGGDAVTVRGQRLIGDLGDVSLELLERHYDSSPLVEGNRVVGRQISLRGKGRVVGTDTGTLIDNALTTYGQLELSNRSVFIVAPLDRVEFELQAAECVDDGPTIRFHVDDASATGFERIIDFTITAAVPSETTVDPYQRSTSAGPDGLRTVRQTSSILDPDAAAAYDVSLSAFLSAYPAEEGWVHSADSTANAAGDRVTYSLEARELADALPGDEGDVVDGELTLSQEADEAGRKTTTYAYDLVIAGDHSDVLVAIRPAETILRESWSLTHLRETRLRATFVVLSSAADDDLLNWQQDLQIDSAGTPWRVEQFSGADPIIVAQRTDVRVLTQTGSAVGLGKYPVPPAALFPSNLLQTPRPRYEHVNDRERKTSWSYVMYVDNSYDPAADVLAMSRPESPTFVEAAS